MRTILQKINNLLIIPTSTPTLDNRLATRECTLVQPPTPIYNRRFGRAFCLGGPLSTADLHIAVQTILIRCVLPVLIFEYRGQPRETRQSSKMERDSRRISLQDGIALCGSSLPSEPVDEGPKSPDSLFSVDSAELGYSSSCHDPENDPAIVDYCSQGPDIDDESMEPACHFDCTDRAIIPFPAVRGLYYLPNLIDHSTENEWMSEISKLNFSNNHSNNQMMFFSRPNFSLPVSSAERHRPDLTPREHSFLNWPPFLVDLILHLPHLLSSLDPPENDLDHLTDLFFGSEKRDLPWQAIINLYRPGEGIEQHLDLVERFDEIILGISLGSNVAMEFQPFAPNKRESRQKLYLQQRSGYIIAQDARYDWTHGIRANQPYDWVYDSSSRETRKILRLRTRVSITIRRLKSSADLLKD